MELGVRIQNPSRNLFVSISHLTSHVLVWLLARQLSRGVRGEHLNMRGGLALFAAEPAVFLGPTVATPPLVGNLAAPGPCTSFLGAGSVLTRSSWPCGGRSHVTPSAGHLHRRRPHPVTGRLCMQDFSSSAYWNKVYSSGVDDSGQEAVAEWHVEGEVMAKAVERLVGDPADGSEELTLLNIGCGRSTLWERWVCVRSYV